MGGGLAECVVLTRRVKAEGKDGCSGASAAVEVGDVDVDLIGFVVCGGVWVRVEVCRWVVFRVSSKSVGDEEKKISLINFGNVYGFSTEQQKHTENVENNKIYHFMIKLCLMCRLKITVV